MEREALGPLLGPDPGLVRQVGVEPGLRFAGTRVELTSPPGFPLAGYGARGDAVAASEHDPLEAVLLSLRDARPAGERVTWIVVDAVAADGGLARAVAEAVGAALDCPPDAVLVCATHTHSGPASWIRRVHPAFPDSADEAMRSELVRRVGEAAAGLAGTEREVRLLVAAGAAPGIGTNRTDPAGPHDASVGLLALIEASGAVGGLLVDHACHATVLGHDNLHWSADWPGAARRTLAAALAAGRQFGEGSESGPRSSPTVAVVQGAAGDASPRFVGRAQSFGEVDRLGGLLAAHALEALLGAGPAAASPGPLLRRDTVRLPTRPLPSPAEARRLTAEAETAWRAIATAEGPCPRERIARTRHEGAQLLASVAEIRLPLAVELPVTVVALGDDAWLHLPVELFTSFGLAIRAGSPFARTRVVGYTDGYYGYVADRAAHQAGVYEASASLFDAAAGRRLVEASINLLRRVRAEARPPGSAPGSADEAAGAAAAGKMP
jgi:hypothetical protein